MKRRFWKKFVRFADFALYANPIDHGFVKVYAARLGITLLWVTFWIVILLTVITFFKGLESW